MSPTDTQRASCLRLLAGWAIVLSLFLTPVAPLLAALSDPMACCSKGTHSCCARKSKAAKTNSFQAKAGCARNGTLTPLAKVGVPKEGSVTYPSVALGMSGRTFVAWTESRGEQGSRAMLIRGRRAQ